MLLGVEIAIPETDRKREVSGKDENKKQKWEMCSHSFTGNPASSRSERSVWKSHLKPLCLRTFWCVGRNGEQYFSFSRHSLVKV